MTKKRFTIIGDDNIEFIMQTKLLLPIYDNKKRLSLKSCCDLLNELHEKNEDLTTKKEDAEYELLHLKEKYEELLEKNKKQFMGIGQLIDKYEELLEENQQLKSEIKKSTRKI